MPYPSIALLVISLLITGLLGCKKPISTLEADSIYFNGKIITVDDSLGTVAAIAIKGERIIALGSIDAVSQHKGHNTAVINLEGKTMLPGFVDAHSHLSAVAIQANAANLLPAPDGPVNNISQLQQTLRDYLLNSDIVSEHKLVMGFNYDDSQLLEQRHPTRHELDAVTKDIPIFALHQSGHLGVYNTKALELVGINAESVNPMGGVIEREADGKTPNGVLQETAHFTALFSLIPKFSPQQYVSFLKAGEATYAANGFTTVQDGKTDALSLQALVATSQANVLDVDVVSYPDIVKVNINTPTYQPFISRDYTNNFRIGGVKLTLDGSPQGKTAWFTHPYHRPPANHNKNFAGYGALSDKLALKWFNLAYKNKWQLMVHANGDAAIDQFIRSTEQAQASFDSSDARTVLIHGQFLRKDQVAKIEQLRVFPALFPMHTFYWGDWHRDSVAGPARAQNISPTGWLMARGIKFSIHSDAPVTFPNSMRVMHSAVNRTTRTGAILGHEHKLSPMDAIKAMTIWPAYQHFEENHKGSLAIGKLADLVILDKNPIEVEPENIKDIVVLETMKAGRTIYSRQPL
jgi:predicted amidohydrolase YtcJ